MTTKEWDEKYGVTMRDAFSVFSDNRVASTLDDDARSRRARQGQKDRCVQYGADRKMSHPESRQFMRVAHEAFVSANGKRPIYA